MTAKVYFVIATLCASAVITSCGSSTEDESVKLKAACEELAFAKSIMFLDYRESEFQKSALTVSKLFDELGQNKPEYLRYSKLAERFAWEKMNMGPKTLFEVCGLN